MLVPGGLRRLLVISGRGSAGQERLERPLFELRRSGAQCVSAVTNGMPWAEPGVVDAMVEVGRRSGVQAVVAAGGGTVMDTAKAVASLLGGRTSCSQWMADPHALQGQPLLMIGLPTTIPGTIAAASQRCVLLDREEETLTAIPRESGEVQVQIDPSFVPAAASLANKSMDSRLAVGSVLAVLTDVLLHQRKEHAVGNQGMDEEVSQVVELLRVAAGEEELSARGLDLDLQQRTALMQAGLRLAPLLDSCTCPPITSSARAILPRFIHPERALPWGMSYAALVTALQQSFHDTTTDLALGGTTAGSLGGDATAELMQRWRAWANQGDKPLPSPTFDQEKATPEALVDALRDALVAARPFTEVDDESESKAKLKYFWPVTAAAAGRRGNSKSEEAFEIMFRGALGASGIR